MMSRTIPRAQHWAPRPARASARLVLGKLAQGLAPAWCAALMIVPALLCAGCPQMLIVKGATTAAGMIADDRSLEQQTADIELKGRIEAALAGESTALAASVNVDTFNGRVMLTGVLRDVWSRSRAARIARETASGQEVYDDIEVSSEGSPIDTVEDAATNKTLGVNLLTNEGIASESLLHRVVNGTAFIMGEGRLGLTDAVRTVALQTPGVRGVVTHITFEQ